MNNKHLNFSLDLSQAEYKSDSIQERLLQSYLRYDKKFQRAFYTNFTGEFIKYIKDKTELNEPIHLTIKGTTRGGKSYSMITACIIHQACYNQEFNINYICANVFEYIKKLQTFPQDKLKNRIFLVDEEKQTIYGVGSTAKKMKVTDVQNIIAINNISTIMINPTDWANKDAVYGLRIFGKCYKTKTCRFMLYDLQAKGTDGSPVGMCYLPIFTALNLPYVEQLEKDYLKKKNAWVMLEQQGKGDVLGELKKDHAKDFSKDSQYRLIKSKDEKIAYISQKLGSEFTKGEVEEIFYITKLLEKGIKI